MNYRNFHENISLCTLFLQATHFTETVGKFEQCPLKIQTKAVSNKKRFTKFVSKKLCLPYR